MIEMKMIGRIIRYLILLMIIFMLLFTTIKYKNEVSELNNILQNRDNTIGLYRSFNEYHIIKMNYAGSEEFKYVVSLYFTFSQLDHAEQLLYAFGLNKKPVIYGLTRN